MSVETKYGADILKQTQEVAEMFKAAMPQIKTNKNGFEIRTKVLEFAQTQAWQDYTARLGAYQTSVTKEGDEVVTTVEMPEVPGADEVLATAQKFYDFVSNNKTK